MKSSLFPQVDLVPSQVKQRIMTHIESDLHYRRQRVFARSKLVKTGVPVFLLAVLFVGFFSLLFSQKNVSPQVSSLSSEEFQILEEKLGEIDQLLLDLEAI